jgi:hypothetical protein
MNRTESHTEKAAFLPISLWAAFFVPPFLVINQTPSKEEPNRVSTFDRDLNRDVFK